MAVERQQESSIWNAALSLSAEAIGVTSSHSVLVHSGNIRGQGGAEADTADAHMPHKDDDEQLHPLIPPEEDAAWPLEAAASDGGTGLVAMRQEAVRLLALGSPMFLQYLFGFGTNIVSLIFVGHLGTVQMSSAVLGSSFSNVSGFALLTGLSSALETLCGQAYGAKQFEQLGISLQRGAMICLLFFIGMIPVWWNFEPLMLTMGQEPVLAAGAARYMRFLIPSLFFGGAFQCLNRYLAAQAIVMPQTWATVGTIALAPLANWVLIYKLGWGLDGAAMANVLVTFCQTFVLTAFVVVRDYRLTGTPEQTWHGWTLKALTGWWSYLCLAAPSAAMIVIEWSTFEVMILLAGLLPNAECATATMGWLLNVSTICYLAPLGLAGAASTRVSNSLGGGLPSAARIAALMAGVVVLIVTIAIALALLLVRSKIGLIFSSDLGVVALGASVLRILAPALIGDGVNAVMSGVLRGAGRQTVGAATNLISYWFVGMPLAAFMAFKLHWGVHGLWAALLVATSVQAVGLSILVSHFDWPSEAAKAVARVHRKVQIDASDDVEQQGELLEHQI